MNRRTLLAGIAAFFRVRERGAAPIIPEPPNLPRTSWPRSVTRRDVELPYKT